MEPIRARMWTLTGAHVGRVWFSLRAHFPGCAIGVDVAGNGFGGIQFHVLFLTFYIGWSTWRPRQYNAFIGNHKWKISA